MRDIYGCTRGQRRKFQVENELLGLDLWHEPTKVCFASGNCGGSVSAGGSKQRADWGVH